MSKQSSSSSSGSIGCGGIGAVIAIVISWTTNHSILWCLIHGICSWFYVFYRLGGCGGALPQ